MGNASSLSAPRAVAAAGPAAGGIQVVLTAGPEAADRAGLAFDLALTAANSGQRVAVFLALGATVWACAAADGLPTAVRQRFEELVRCGVPVACCARCAAASCGDGMRLYEGVVLAGLATLVETIAVGTRTITF